jgi:Arginase/agmatinase/formimionoglutamate hydrolase, arginase family
MRNIKIVEVKSEIGAGTRGASLGVDAIKIAALDFMSNFFVNFPSDVVETENKLLYEPVESPYAKRIRGIKSMYERVAKVVESNIKSGLFPVVLAGDHSTAGGTIAGIKMAKPNSRLGAIWIDAHADLHSPYTTPSGNMHGMPLAVSLALDNMDCQVHQPDDATISTWNELKNMGKIAPKVLPEDLVFIALRDTEKEEDF